MTIDILHPLYTNFLPYWRKVRDCYAGEEEVKKKGQTYLPATSGMILDGMDNPNQLGWKTYEAYKLRAVWHDLFKDAIEVYIGLLHQKSPTIELDTGMEEVKSNTGETPEQLLRRINEEQLVSGRLGLLADLPVRPNQVSPVPYISMYPAEMVRNWDVGEDESNQAVLNYVILDESGWMRQPENMFGWQQQTRYRICQMGTIADENDLKYLTAVFSAAGANAVPTYDPLQLKAPVLRGVPLTSIPFTFVNTKDLLSNPDFPPLLGLANAMFAIYRGEGDYRQNLFMQGQDTLAIIGARQKVDPTQPEAPLRTGAGSRIEVEQGGDVKYVGVNSSGLPEQRQALQNDITRAETRSGQLINARLGDKESGSALQTRLAAQTATLRQIALAGAAGLENSLKQSAVWMGKDPNKVKVTPNLDFNNLTTTGQDAMQLMQAKDLGFPISYESIHAWMVSRGFTRKTFQEEFDQIKTERSQILVLKSPAPPSNTPPGG